MHTVCGLTKESIENLLPANSDTKISLNFEDVLKIKEIDIVDICLPPHLHFSACKKSLEAGKHVICEKPLHDGSRPHSSSTPTPRPAHRHGKTSGTTRQREETESGRSKVCKRLRMDQGETGQT